MIGDEYVRGVSGGQRKRVNVGMEVVTAPSVLFLVVIFTFSYCHFTIVMNIALIKFRTNPHLALIQLHLYNCVV